MKKTFLKSAMIAVAMLCGAQANASIDYTFTNGGVPEGLTISDGGEATVSGGQLHVKMGLAGNGKYRGDLKFENAFSLNPATDKVLAFKFQGTNVPDGAKKMEFNDGSWYNKKWNSGWPYDLYDDEGNKIYYFLLTDDEDYTAWTEEKLIKKLNLIIADNVTVQEYSIDWIKTFASVDELQANASIKDDGAADEQGEVADPDVKNLNSGVAFTTLTDAINAAVDGDVIEVYKDQTIGDRITLDKEITIKGDAKIVRGFKNKLLFIIKKAVAFEGVTFTNAEEHDCSTPLLEISSKCDLKDVKILNVSSTHNQGILCVKGGGNLKVENVVFDGCKVADADGRNSNIFFGFNSRVTFSGDCGTASVFVERENGVVEAENLTNTTPILLNLAEKAITDREEGTPVVSGTSDVTKFTLVNADNSLEADIENNALVLSGTTTIISTVANESETPLYNIAGQKVGTDYRGLVIKHGKKVVVK